MRIEEAQHRLAEIEARLSELDGIEHFRDWSQHERHEYRSLISEQLAVNGYIKRHQTNAKA